MLTEPVTVFFKFVIAIGRYEFFVKTFLAFSQMILALDIQDVKIISPVFYNC